MEHTALDRKTLICYSLGNIGPIGIFMFVCFYLMEFYTDVAHLSPDLIGYALLFALTLSALTNILTGYISDHTRWRIGRRRPYFLIGIIPAGILFFLTFSYPHSSQGVIFAYLTVTTSLMFIFLAVFETPYNALGPELTYDYNERLRLSGYRRTLEICGEIIGLFLLPLLLIFHGTFLNGVLATEQSCYVAITVVIGTLAILMGCICYWGSWERHSETPKSEYDYKEGLITTLRNRPFRILLLTYMLAIIADNIIITQLMYIIKHVFAKQKQEILLFLIPFLIGSLCTVPLWLFLGKILGKKATYIVAMLAYPIIFASLALYHWSDAMVYSFAFLGGVGNAGLYMLPTALVPDIIEWDQLATHQRREGAYMGMWVFISKAGIGLSFVVVGISLAVIGYHGDEQITPQTLLGLRVCFVALPLLFMLLACYLFAGFPITKQKHEEMRKELENQQRLGVFV